MEKLIILIFDITQFFIKFYFFFNYFRLIFIKQCFSFAPLNCKKNKKLVCTVKKNNAIGYPLVIAISLIIIKKILFFFYNY